MDKLKDKPKSKLLSKIRDIKHLDIAIVIIFVGVLLLIYFNDFTSSKESDEVTQTFISYKSYTEDLEKRLTNVLSKIDGVGNVDVMVTLEGSPELVIAYNIEEVNNLGNEGIVTKKEPIIITKNGVSSPLVLSEVLPKIKGIVIVAQGGGDVKVKMDLLTATTKLFNVSVNCIEIFARS